MAYNTTKARVYLAMVQDISLAEHRKWCVAKPGNCPFEKKYDEADSIPAVKQKERDRTDSDGFENVTPEEFHDVILAAKMSCDPKDRWRVDVKSVDDYKKCKALIVSEGGSCVAVEPNGDIVSVCHNDGDSATRGRDLIKAAKERGGNRLDAFDGIFGFYVKCGMKPMTWTPFNEEYKPDGWEKTRDAGENVVFFGVGAYNGVSASEWERTVSPQGDYDSAMAKRDSMISNERNK